MNEELFLKFISNILGIHTWHIISNDNSLSDFEKE